MAIPKKTADEVMYKSDRKCPMCKKLGHQIHHIDDNNCNNDIHNLIYLCVVHHNEAHTKSYQARKLSEGLLKKYREVHYQEVIEIRENRRREMTGEDELMVISIMKADNLKKFEVLRKKFWETSIAQRPKILADIYDLKEYMSEKLFGDLFKFLLRVSESSRRIMNEELSSSLLSLVSEYIFEIPQGYGKTEKNEVFQKTIAIGFNTTYDSFIYLKNYKCAMNAMLIFKAVYSASSRFELHSEIATSILRMYTDLENALQRPERTDLGPSLDLLNIFRDDLYNGPLIYPEISQELYEHIYIKQFN